MNTVKVKKDTDSKPINVPEKCVGVFEKSGYKRVAEEKPARKPAKEKTE